MIWCAMIWYVMILYMRDTCSGEESVLISGSDDNSVHHLVTKGSAVRQDDKIGGQIGVDQCKREKKTE